MSAKWPICHNEYFIVKDLLFTGMGPQGVPLGSKIYISLNVLIVGINSTRVPRRKKLF